MTNGAILKNWEHGRRLKISLPTLPLSHPFVVPQIANIVAFMTYIGEKEYEDIIHFHSRLRQTFTTAMIIKVILKIVSTSES